MRRSILRPPLSSPVPDLWSPCRSWREQAPDIEYSSRAAQQDEHRHQDGFRAEQAIQPVADGDCHHQGRDQSRSPPAGRSPRGSCRRGRRSLRADDGGGASSPCLLRAAFSLSSKEGGSSSSPGSSLMSAPDRKPCRKAGACYSWGWTVSRMQPARCGGISGPLCRRHRPRGGFVGDHRRDHVATVGLHR